MEYPEILKYTEDHEWVKIEDGIATIGITEYAVEQMGDIAFVELPAEGDEFDVHATIGTVESTKAVSDIFCPISGKVIEVNELLNSSPDVLQQDPYEEGWLVKLEISDSSQLEELLSASEYEALLEEQED